MKNFKLIIKLLALIILSFNVISTFAISENCISWDNGCNTCTKGELGTICTQRACLPELYYKKVKCLKYKDKTIVGGDKDIHGCIGSAGYTWCETKNKCIRPWEEKCIKLSIKTQDKINFTVKKISLKIKNKKITNYQKIKIFNKIINKLEEIKIKKSKINYIINYLIEELNNEKNKYNFK